MGYVEESDLPRAFEGCFAIILPYMAATGTSGVLHLATGFGLPVVSTNLPEIRELLEAGPGLILSNSADEMVRALDRLLADKSYWSEMSRKSLEFSKNMRWENVADVFLDVMEHIEVR
jgi:glycosyltransferase involved in cell wall biosynthesis